ncbi:hypothetical protein RD055328_12510 [Companilactobacillus sp. RD055328]|uniref:DUF2975 domain-containing protein n=1 Tax=Companilactobacillus sp. RD055328 TaxID=2916634 RepID=UPI001FC80642|nr:DUF2975 domain-containing protein [Companilactobacillus sp. RD055328]GKQ43328.1 hypothetical protein RD055328_12510 [Companilactobacillus sp. RD055328]
MRKRVNLLKIVVILATLGFFIMGAVFTMIVVLGNPDIMWKNSVYLTLVMVYLIDILALSTGITLYKLLNLINHGQLVSEDSLTKMKRISTNLLFITIFSIGILPMFYNFAQESDAPGVMGLGFLMFGIALTVYSISWVLEGLLRSNLDQRKEDSND